MSKNNRLITLPIEFLANINGRPKPFIQTWLLLKTRNKSSHYKNLNKRYQEIAKSINVSESTLRKHIKQMVYEGFASISNNTLRLVSKWRNPIRNKSRDFTKTRYGSLSKTQINPLNIKLEVFQYQLKQQISRQNYCEKERLNQLGRRQNSVANRIKSELLTNIFENGSTGRIRKAIYNDESIPLTQKENVFDQNRKCLNMVCEALSSHLAKQEKNSISKSSQLSLNKLSELTGYASCTSLRSYRRALKVNSGLREERDSSIPLKDKKFSFTHHYKDKFGNIYRKRPIRYNVGTTLMEDKVSVSRGSNIPCI